MEWNPTQYHRFRAEREAPFADALALVRRRPGLRVIDLGCGTGELTAALAEALPESAVLGIDTSPEMLAQAAQLERPGLRFAAGRLEEATGSWDLVFSHAALQWVDDHHRLLRRLWDLVAPGGQFVVQLPSNHDHASHRLMAEVAGEAPFAAAFDGWRRRTSVLSIEQYATALWALGGTDICVFEKVYPVEMADAAGIVAWVRGTALQAYLQRLPEALRAAYEARYHAKLAAEFPSSPVFYAFKRTLWSAAKP